MTIDLIVKMVKIREAMLFTMMAKIWQSKKALSFFN